jgi:hypothetical protein
MATQWGLEPSEYSTHSLRRGAAHNAALAGVNDSAIKVMGRWESARYTIYTDLTPYEAAAQRAQKGC